MNKGLKIVGVLIGIPVVIVGILYINTYVYPFQSKQPNFADVEAAFAKLQFPADWQVISSTQNRGIAGRGCDPFNASGCFSKSKSFKTKDVAIAKEKMKEILTSQAGCASISEEVIPEGNSNTDPLTATSMKCITDTGVAYLVSTSLIKGEVGVTATTSY